MVVAMEQEIDFNGLDLFELLTLAKNIESENTLFSEELASMHEAIDDIKNQIRDIKIVLIELLMRSKDIKIVLIELLMGGKLMGGKNEIQQTVN